MTSSHSPAPLLMGQVSTGERRVYQATDFIKGKVNDERGREQFLQRVA